MASRRLWPLAHRITRRQGAAVGAGAEAHAIAQVPPGSQCMHLACASSCQEGSALSTWRTDRWVRLGWSRAGWGWLGLHGRAVAESAPRRGARSGAGRRHVDGGDDHHHRHHHHDDDDDDAQCATGHSTRAVALPCSLGGGAPSIAPCTTLHRAATAEGAACEHAIAGCDRSCLQASCRLTGLIGRTRCRRRVYCFGYVACYLSVRRLQANHKGSSCFSVARRNSVAGRDRLSRLPCRPLAA
eukprot:scaffold201_cov405-Prasinococcus_capsulatus_cf.AAC.42